MAKVSFRDLKVGDVAQVAFKGSARLGNDPHELEVRVKSVSSDRVVTDVTEFYFASSRWRYGTSAEVAQVLSVVRA